MTQNKDKLSGIIEIDETYIGGKQSRKFGSGFMLVDQNHTTR